MKKLILLLLSLTLVLTACTKSEIEGEAIPTPSPEVTEIPTEENAEDKKEEIKEEIKEDKKEETPSPEKTPEPQKTPAPTPAPQNPDEVLGKILSGVETPKYEIVPITEENFSYMMFTDYVEGAKGFSADALISSTAHSVCLVTLPEGSDVSAFANRVRKNADPRKWICVEAEKVEVVTKGNMVLLVMSDSATTDKIVNNFKNN